MSQNRSLSQPPPVLAVWAVLIVLVVFLSRETFQREVSPAFVPFQPNVIHVEISVDDMAMQMHQFYDGLTPLDVIKLTEPALLAPETLDQQWARPLISGERLKLIKNGRKIEALRREWMPSSHRLAMVIPLHPDRMTQTDWQILPGVGTVLAERIENDRQKNGDYGRLEKLKRVNGVGKKRIDSWRQFFL